MFGIFCPSFAHHMDNFNCNKSAIRTQISNYQHKFVLTNRTRAIFDVSTNNSVESNTHLPCILNQIWLAKLSCMCAFVSLFTLFLPFDMKIIRHVFNVFVCVFVSKQSSWHLSSFNYKTKQKNMMKEKRTKTRWNSFNRK